MLTDPQVGISPNTDIELAIAHCFEYLLEQTLTWQREVAAGKVSFPGALLHRIQHSYFRNLRDTDRKTELFRRHACYPGSPYDTDSEDARRYQYIPDDYADIILG